MHWYDYLWIWTILYFTLGLFNILFAWLGMIDFLVPLFIALFSGGKAFCNTYCGRGQLFSQLGSCVKCSRDAKAPRFLASKWFRYGFLVFFLTMFGNMVSQTYLVAATRVGDCLFGLRRQDSFALYVNTGNISRSIKERTGPVGWLK